VSELVNSFLTLFISNVRIAMYDSGCQIYCNCTDSSRVLNCQHTEVHTMPQIYMISHPVTVNWHWANHSRL